MKLLVNESPLIVLPSVVKILGLNEAIVLQQLHYLLLNSPLKYDGYTWYFHSYNKWHESFPFWSEKTISRIFLKLEGVGYIVSTHQYNRMKIDRTKWYRIDYRKLQEALEGHISMPKQFNMS